MYVPFCANFFFIFQHVFQRITKFIEKIFIGFSSDTNYKNDNYQSFFYVISDEN